MTITDTNHPVALRRILTAIKFALDNPRLYDNACSMFAGIVHYPDALDVLEAISDLIAVADSGHRSAQAKGLSWAVDDYQSVIAEAGALGSFLNDRVADLPNTEAGR